MRKYNKLAQIIYFLENRTSKHKIHTWVCLEGKIFNIAVITIAKK